MNTFWKKMAAFGFGVAFSLLSAAVAPANSGGEGFDFTDEKSASEEWNAMKKQKEEEKAKKKAEEEAAAAAEYRAQNPTGDDLLKLIYDEMRIQNGKEPVFKK